MYRRFLGLFFSLCLCGTAFAAISVNSSELYLSENNFEIVAVPQTRTYSWTLTNQTAALDGFARPTLAINGQFPGPLIRANTGDRILVKLTNKMSLPVTIHWHGIYQNGTNFMDGVTGITQCPIPPGTTFTYDFTLRNQWGTYWYHAHAQNLVADGIAGPFIIHSPDDPLVLGRDYNAEYILFMNDWYNRTSNYILSDALYNGGYLSAPGVAPSPNSALLNGIGKFNCAFAPEGSTCTDVPAALEFRVRPNTKTRLRLINAGSHAMFFVSADDHLLEVVEADYTAVTAPSFQRIQMHNAQRYSVILDTANDTDGSSFYLRAQMDSACFAWQADGVNNTALAIVRVVDQNVSTTDPTTVDWTQATNTACVDLDISAMHPIIPVDTATQVVGRVMFENSFGFQTVTQSDGSVLLNGRFFIDNGTSPSTTWLTYTYRPVLHDLVSTGQGFVNDSAVTSVTLPTLGTYDIIINNLDAGIDHPYHLHGVDSHIVATGTGKLTFEAAETLTYSTTNPMRRDTYVVPGGSYHVIRVVADNPGAWIIHCHIGWHLGAGLAGVMVVNPSEIRTWNIPVANLGLCSRLNAETFSDTEPGRRSLDEHNYFPRITVPDVRIYGRSEEHQRGPRTLSSRKHSRRLVDMS